MGKTIGFSYELKEGEDLLIESTNFGEIYFEKKGLLPFKAFSATFDFSLGFEVTEADRILVLPFLTNQRMIFWCLYVSKFGAIGKWVELPFDFIDDLKFEKVGGFLGMGAKGVIMKVKYRIPHLKAGLLRKLVGLGPGAEKLEMSFKFPAIAAWQMHLTKIMMGRKPGPTPPTKGERFCVHCGNPIPPDAAFCSKCGKPQNK